jgi:hypothetical protein
MGAKEKPDRRGAADNATVMMQRTAGLAALIDRHVRA